MLTAVISGWQDLGKCLLLFHMLLICVNFFMMSMKHFHIQSKRVIFNLKEIKCVHEDIWVCSVAQLCPTLCWPYGLDYNPPGSSVHWIFQARILEWVPTPGDLPNPGIELTPLVSLAWWADSLPLTTHISYTFKNKYVKQQQPSPAPYLHYLCLLFINEGSGVNGDKAKFY